MKNPISVAIADHQTIIRKGLVDSLRSYGVVTIAEGGDGAELIKNIESLEQLPDICILDVAMKGMNGYDTITALNDRWPTIKTLVYTTLINEFSLVRMIGSGARGYISKGGPVEELHDALLEIHLRGYYFSQFEIETLPVKKQNQHHKKYFFSEQEVQFLKYSCTELTYKEIAEKMNASKHTIDNYRESLFLRLKVKSRVGLVMFAIKTGIVYV